MSDSDSGSDDRRPGSRRSRSRSRSPRRREHKHKDRHRSRDRHFDYPDDDDFVEDAHQAHRQVSEQYRGRGRGSDWGRARGGHQPSWRGVARSTHSRAGRGAGGGTGVRAISVGEVLPGVVNVDGTVRKNKMVPEVDIAVREHPLTCHVLGFQFFPSPAVLR